MRNKKSSIPSTRDSNGKMCEDKLGKNSVNTLVGHLATLSSYMAWPNFAKVSVFIATNIYYVGYINLWEVLLISHFSAKGSHFS